MKTSHPSYWIIAFVFLTSFSLVQAEEKPPTITVSGSAQIQVVPDKAVLTFSIESREENLDASVKDNDTKVKAVVDFLKASGVEARYIRTEVITINPIYESRNNWQSKSVAQQSINAPGFAPNVANTNKSPKLKPVGYMAKRQIALTIKNLQRFEVIYRGLIERGVNDVGGIQFQSSELRKHKDEARLKAIQAAREKAAALAGALGAKLFKVQTITEGSGSWRPMFQNSISMAPSESSEGVEAGMIQISATVNVVFVLKETELDD